MVCSNINQTVVVFQPSAGFKNDVRRTKTLFPYEITCELIEKP